MEGRLAAALLPSLPTDRPREGKASMSKARNRRFLWETAIMQSDLHPTTRHVAHAIATHMDVAGRCWPGAQLLSDKTGLAKRTVEKQRKLLLDGGWLKRQFLPSSPGEKLSTPRKTYLACVPVGKESVSTDAKSVPPDAFESVATDAITDHYLEQNKNRPRTVPKKWSVEGDLDQAMLRETLALTGSSGLQSRTTDFSRTALLTSGAGGRSIYPNVSKVVDADGNFVDERVIESESQEVALTDLGLSVYRVRGLQGDAA